MDVTPKIRELLKERNWSVYKLAQESELTEKTIYKWMRHESQPTVKALYSVCQAFGITLSEFFADGILIEVSDEIKELYKDWVSLTKEEQDALRALVKRNVKK